LGYHRFNDSHIKAASEERDRKYAAQKHLSRLLNSGDQISRLKICR
jgi:hypothetical protein